MKHLRIDERNASALSHLFSARIFRDFGKQGKSALFSRLIQQAHIAELLPHTYTVGKVFDVAFDQLSRSPFRDDYVYRSALTQKILLGRHSLNTATLLSEFRAGSSKADVVVLNGTSTAYEIKSERDSLNRLTSQLANYRQVFATVYVVTSRTHLSEVLNAAPADVGVITLSDRFRLQTEREALTRPERTIPTMILETLRTTEASEVLTRLGHAVPDVPNTRRRTELSLLFAQLDATSAHGEAVKVLKQTRSQASLANFVRSVPGSVRAISLAINPNARSQTHILEAFDTPLVDALGWR
ncbi:sce7726 family protein [Georgenia phoenicis]|uniref:sce7726 family protein n=1 Tax=unclassified Georgenia TaxID=2626815 RepID=UPI0039B05FA9